MAEEKKGQTKKLLFLNDAIVDGKVVYKKGEANVPVEGGSAERWIKRGAIDLEAQAKQEEATKKANDDATKEAKARSEEIKKKREEEQKKTDSKMGAADQRNAGVAQGQKPGNNQGKSGHEEL